MANKTAWLIDQDTLARGEVLAESGDTLVIRLDGIDEGRIVLRSRDVCFPTARAALTRHLETIDLQLAAMRQRRDRFERLAALHP